MVGLNGIETQDRPRRLGQPLGWTTQHRWCWEGKRPQIDTTTEKVETAECRELDWWLRVSCDAMRSDWKNLNDGMSNPPALSFEEVILRFVRIVPGDPSRDFVPAYHFRILLLDGADVGHINFRVGDTNHVRICAGHIGFEIGEEHRGHGYAFEACRAIAPFVRSIYDEVIITCDPDNVASRRTIEKLGASFMDEVPVPEHDPHYKRGSRLKRRYKWVP